MTNKSSQLGVSLFTILRHCMFPLLVGLVTCIILKYVPAISKLGDPELNVLVALHIIFYAITYMVFIIFMIYKKSGLNPLIYHFATVNIFLVLCIILSTVYPTFTMAHFIEIYCIIISLADCLWGVYCTIKYKHDSKNLNVILRICTYSSIYFTLLTFYMNNNDSIEPFILGTLAIHLILPVYLPKLCESNQSDLFSK